MKRSIVFSTFVALLVGSQMMPSRASSHREAPLISGDPQADTTDLYAFVSPDAPDTVTLLASWVPFEDPAGGPNFYKFGDNVLYEIKIDNTGDGAEDITYQFRFTSQIKNPNTFLYATGPITGLDDRHPQLLADLHGDPHRGRPNGLDRWTDADDVRQRRPGVHARLWRQWQRHLRVRRGGGTAHVFAGQTDDPFFLDLRIFDLLYGGESQRSWNRQPRGIQRPQHRVAGAQVLAAFGGQPDHRRLGHVEPSGEHHASGWQ